MPDYSKGKIYRLTCDDPNLVYYGSTVLTLSRRFSIHKGLTNNCVSKKLFKVGGVEIELVLECPCDSLKQLREVEQTYIDNDNCINERNANLNKKDYDRKYKQTEKSKEYDRKYQQTQKSKECRSKYQKLKYQEYLFTKDIFDEYLS